MWSRYQTPIIYFSPHRDDGPRRRSLHFYGGLTAGRPLLSGWAVIILESLATALWLIIMTEYNCTYHDVFVGNFLIGRPVRTPNNQPHSPLFSELYDESSLFKKHTPNHPANSSFHTECRVLGGSNLVLARLLYPIGFANYSSNVATSWLALSISLRKCVKSSVCRCD